MSLGSFWKAKYKDLIDNMNKMSLLLRLLSSLTVGFLLAHPVLAATSQSTNQETVDEETANDETTGQDSTLSPEEKQLHKALYNEILNSSEQNTAPQSRPELSVQGLYDAFKFNSTVGDLYNRFYGRTQFINLGGENLNFHDVTVGFNVTAVNTRMNGSQSIQLKNYQYTTTSIDNTAMHMHVTKQLSNNFSVDLAGGVGQSQYTLTTTSIFPVIGAQVPSGILFGNAGLTGFNEYLGGRFTASQSFQKWSLQGDAGYIYSNYQQPGYNITYTDGSSTPVLSLITRIGLITENARLSYQVDDHLVPYIMGGLIQVVSLSYSNPIIQPTTISPLPQLSLTDSGFLLGTGLSYEYKFIRVSPLYQFTQRGTNYFDNLGALKIDLLF